MIVTCQSCLQHYKLDESKVNPLGSKVKCAKCKVVFTVFPPNIEPMVEDLAPLPSPPTPSTTQPPPPPTPSTTQPPPPPTPSTTQPPPPPTPSTTQAPKAETRDSASQEVVLEAGPDDVVIVMSGADTVPLADSVEAGPDEVVFATSDADKAPVADPKPSLAFEAEKDPDLVDAEDEPPKKLSVKADEYSQGSGEEEAPSNKGCLSIFFFLLLFPAVIYGALVYLDKKGFEMPWLEGLNLPYISQSSDVKQSLPHEMITVADINSRFIRNNDGSPLFVISGKLTNQGDKAQQAVQVTGELFDEANSVLARKIAVGGRFLSDLDLLALSQGELEQKLSSMNKATETPVIDAGASLPFMVVFFDPDDRLKEFSIKVTGSEPAL